jgi:hypothetical protein
MGSFYVPDFPLQIPLCPLLEPPAEGPRKLADVYLNGELLAHHRDQYLPLRLNVTGKLHDHNTLLGSE